MAKPFNFAELDARVRALLRRNFKMADTVIHLGNVTLDTATKRLYKSDEEMNLTRKEYAIIEYLFLHKGETIAISELIEHIWESDEDNINSFKVHLSTLRKKIT